MIEENISQIAVHEIVQLMANFVNYLDVSLYEGLFTYNDEQSRAIVNSIYKIVSSTPSLGPSLELSTSFYNNIIFLEKVTDTDDQDYHMYLRKLKNYILLLKQKQ
jgi:hypothetical protein